MGCKNKINQEAHIWHNLTLRLQSVLRILIRQRNLDTKRKTKTKPSKNASLPFSLLSDVETWHRGYWSIWEEEAGYYSWYWHWCHINIDIEILIKEIFFTYTRKLFFGINHHVILFSGCYQSNHTDGDIDIIYGQHSRLLSPRCTSNNWLHCIGDSFLACTSGLIFWD